jgi:NADPH:quinone reductase-like Zn-dependent oxidoreductase
MRAIALQKYGGPEALELVEIPRPVPKANQVLIRVHASSVNPIDWKLGSGKLRLVYPISLPFIPGFDVSGEVVELGSGVTEFQLGDRVHARLERDAGAGAAEYSVVGLAVLVKMPDSMSYGEAAALPLAGMTAFQGLRDDLGLPLEGARGRILIVGASGGVGHFAVQLACAFGLQVTAVCSPRNAEMVRRLGAHEVIDYTAPAPYQGQQPFDAIFDCVGGSVRRWLGLLAPRGRLASPIPSVGFLLRGLLNPLTARKARATMLKTNAADLAYLDRLFEQGKLRPVIDSRFPLEQFSRAWERSQSGRAAGKVVVDVNSSGC